MREQSTRVMLATLFLFGCSTLAHPPVAKALDGCPNLALHETAQDCPWAQASRDTTGLTNISQIRETLDRDAPGFMPEIFRDGKSKRLLSLWGLSSNVDESNLANGTLTVPANIVNFLVTLWQVPYNSNFTMGSAALNHTYGYLFSNVWTPFGFKRARYVKGELEAGFGFPVGFFSGVPPKGTLLSNLTLFAGRIGFNGSPNSTRDLQDALNTGDVVHVSEILKYDYTKLHVQRLVEVIDNTQFHLELRTDIVDFPNVPANGTPKGTDSALLVYSVDFHAPGQAERPRLITAFPVNQSFAAGIFNPKNLGDQVPLKLKYNAALPVTIPAELMVGKRYQANE